MHVMVLAVGVVRHLIARNNFGLLQDFLRKVFIRTRLGK